MEVVKHLKSSRFTNVDMIEFDMSKLCCDEKVTLKFMKGFLLCSFDHYAKQKNRRLMQVINCLYANKEMLHQSMHTYIVHENVYRKEHNRPFFITRREGHILHTFPNALCAQ